MSGPMPPAQNGRGLFGIPHGADYNPRLDPFAGGGGGQWRSGMGHGQARVPMPMPRPRAGAVGPGGVPRTYTGQTQQIPATQAPKAQGQVPSGTPNKRVTPQDVDPTIKTNPPAAAAPPPPRSPGSAAVPPPKTASVPLPRPRPGEPVIDRANLPPPPADNPMAAALLAAMERRKAAGGQTVGEETPTEVARTANASQAPPSRGGIGSDAAAAARTAGATTAATPDWPQRPNVEARKGGREDAAPVDPNIKAQADYEAQKKELVKAILAANSPRPSNWKGSQQIGVNIYNPLAAPTIPKTGPHAGQIKPGGPQKVDRTHKDSDMAFYTTLGVQPGDKIAATKALAALVKQREIAPSSITPAQDRLLASVGKSDAFNLSIEPNAMFNRLKPTQPEHMDLIERKKGPMDTQFEARPEFQNRTDEWRKGVAKPDTTQDPAEKVTKQYIDRLGDPPKEGTKGAPTQKDVDAQNKANKESGGKVRDKFGREVIPPAKGGGEAEVEEDDEEITIDTGGQDP